LRCIPRDLRAAISNFFLCRPLNRLFTSPSQLNQGTPYKFYRWEEKLIWRPPILIPTALPSAIAGLRPWATAKSRQMKLDADEFIRRFLWHVLPKRYHKIRHYGFLANSCRKARVSQIRSLLQIESDTSEAGPKKETGIKCSACGSGRMQPRIIIDRFGRLISRGLDFKTNEAFDTS